MTRRRALDDWKRFEWERSLRMLRLPATAKLVGLVLATYVDGETGENAHPGEERLAADCGLSVRAVRQHLGKLRDVGLIERTQKGRANQHARTADTYALRLPATQLGLTPNHPALLDRWSRQEVPVARPFHYERPSEPLPAPDDTATGT